MREAVADKNSQGLVVDISADYYNEGDTVPYIKNGSPAEKAFDAQSSIVREAVADKNSQGLVVDISADYYNEGDTVPYIKNGSPLDVHLKGEFETQHDTAAIIKSGTGGRYQR